MINFVSTFKCFIDASERIYPTHRQNQDSLSADSPNQRTIGKAMLHMRLLRKYWIEYWIYKMYDHFAIVL